MRMNASEIFGDLQAEVIPRILGETGGGEAARRKREIDAVAHRNVSCNEVGVEGLRDAHRVVVQG